LWTNLGTRGKKGVDAAGRGDVVGEFRGDVAGITPDSASEVVGIGDADWFVVGHSVACLAEVVEAGMNFGALGSGGIDGLKVGSPDPGRMA
jgi:hypothetical protein